MAAGSSSWLNTDSLTTILGENGRKTVKVIEYKIKSGSAAGINNHFGETQKLKVIYVDVNTDTIPKTVHLFIKTINPSGFLSNLLVEGEYLQKEREIYEKVLPLMLKKKNIEFAANYYPSTLPNVYILQDLTEEGFVTLDRMQRMDFEHCALIMKTVSKFHAISIVAHKENPKIVERAGRELGCTNVGGPYSNVAKRSLKNLCDEVESWEGYERFADMLRRKLETYPQDLADCFKKSKNLNVLNHGDLWTTNVLFKYDRLGNVVDARFVDYQICRYGSPALDLQYFFWSSANFDVLTDRLEELYSIYLKNLNEQLNSLQCVERLTEDQLKEELQLTEAFALFVLTLVEQFLVLDSEVPVDFDEKYYFNVGDDGYDPLKVMTGMKYFQSCMKPILNILEMKGILK